MRAYLHHHGSSEAERKLQVVAHFLQACHRLRQSGGVVINIHR
jgi:hypothetical protein